MEKKFSFLDYIEEIRTVSRVNKVDMGVAFDMFMTDVHYGAAHEYNTGDALPGFDFAAASERWNALTKEEQLAAIREWHNRRK